MTEVVVDFNDEETPAEKSKAIALFNPQTVVASEVFVDKGLDPTIEKIKAEVRSKFLDISTPEGRAEIKRLTRRIGSIKRQIDDMGAELKSPLKIQVDVIDAERLRMRRELETLQEEVERDLSAWMEKENARTEGHEAAIKAYADAAIFGEMTPTSAFVQSRIADLENPVIREWDEFKIRAEGTRVTSLETLRKILAERLQAEKDAAELAEHRRQQAEREQQEREKRIADEAAAQARKDAEEKAERDAKIERDRVAAEQKKKDDDTEAERVRLKKVADDAATAAARAEQERKDAEARAEQAEKDRVEAEKNAESARLIVEQKAKDAEKEAAEKATREEKQRAEDERKENDRLTEERQKDLSHKKSINNAAVAAIVGLSQGLNEDQAKAVIVAIAQKKIPNVEIKY